MMTHKLIYELKTSIKKLQFNFLFDWTNKKGKSGYI